MAESVKAELGGIILGAGKLAVLRWLPFADKTYEKKLRELMDNTSESSFRNYISYFAGMVKLTKRNSKQFRNSSRETNFILQQFPRLQQHRSITLGVVKAHRQKCKLPV